MFKSGFTIHSVVRICQTASDPAHMHGATTQRMDRARRSMQMYDPFVKTIHERYCPLRYFYLSDPALLRAGKTLVERVYLTHVMLKVKPE